MLKIFDILNHFFTAVNAVEKGIAYDYTTSFREFGKSVNLKITVAESPVPPDNAQPVDRLNVFALLVNLLYSVTETGTVTEVFDYQTAPGVVFSLTVDAELV